MKNKAFIWGGAIILLLILAAGGFFAFQLLMGERSAKPEIYLLQPVEPQTIDNTDGFLFIAAAQAKKGIDRIEFLVNGSLTAKKFPDTEGATELLSQIAWVPSTGVGVYEMTFIAYDAGGAASMPASITIGVISKGLSQQDADEIILAVASSTPSQVSGGGMAGGGGAAAQAGGEGDALNGDNGIGEGGEMQFFEVGGDLDQIRPFESDFPPDFVGPFTFSMSREAEGVMVALSASAQDDHGVETMYIVGEVEGAVDAPVSMAQPCLGANPCTIQASVLLRQGIHRIRAVAVDSIGQFAMHSQSHLVEVTDNQLAGEPPAVAEEALGEGLLDARFMAGLMEHAGGRFEMHPFLNLGLFFDEESDPEEELEDCSPDCPPTTLADIRVDVDQFYDEDGHPVLMLKCVFPPNLQAEAENPTYGIFIPEFYPRFPQLHCRTAMTPAILSQGTVARDNPRIDASYQKYCGGSKASFAPAMAIKDFLGLLEIVEQGNPLAEVVPLKCPPPAPVIISLEATKNCPDSNNNNAFCLILKWEPALSDPEQLAVDRYHLIQSNLSLGGNIVDTEYSLDADETSFIQTEVQQGWVYEFKIYSLSQDGIRSSASKINIRVPRPMDEPYRISYDWRESR